MGKCQKSLNEQFKSKKPTNAQRLKKHWARSAGKMSDANGKPWPRPVPCMTQGEGEGGYREAGREAQTNMARGM